MAGMMWMDDDTAVVRRSVASEQDKEWRSAHQDSAQQSPVPDDSAGP